MGTAAFWSERAQGKGKGKWREASRRRPPQTAIQPSVMPRPAPPPPGACSLGHISVYRIPQSTTAQGFGLTRVPKQSASNRLLMCTAPRTASGSLGCPPPPSPKGQGGGVTATPLPPLTQGSQARRAGGKTSVRNADDVPCPQETPTPNSKLNPTLTHEGGGGSVVNPLASLLPC